MRNIKLVIEYEGTNYTGWQEQRVKGPLSTGAVRNTGSFGSPDPKKELCRSGNLSLPKGTAVGPVPTIQACLREAIHKVTGEWVVLYAASRTDAGVHALGQVVNFKTSSHIPVEKLVPAINFYLPKEIAVRTAEEVPGDFHAQFDATSKVYKYTVLNDPIPRALDRNLSYRFPWSLDIEKMRQATSYLLGSHDFRSFSVESLPKKDCTRNIKSFEITQEDRYIQFVVEASGFLHKMIRGIVGTLLMVGSGKMTIEEFQRILQAKDRRLAGPTVPARGLCLLKVKYNEETS